MQHTVPASIICFLSSGSFEDAIRRAIWIGGDSDTLACITGSIAEAYYKDIPPYMVKIAEEKLDDYLLNTVHRFRELYF
ncbi:MAG: ADP-ribosylglycohydrolase family protein [Bacteroidota bacterium]